jgi:hypothetical protein
MHEVLDSIPSSAKQTNKKNNNHIKNSFLLFKNLPSEAGGGAQAIRANIRP